MPENHTSIKWLTYGQNDHLLQREQMLEIATGFPYGHLLQRLEQHERAGGIGSQRFFKSPILSGSMNQGLGFAQFQVDPIRRPNGEVYPLFTITQSGYQLLVGSQ